MDKQKWRLPEGSLVTENGRYFHHSKPIRFNEAEVEGLIDRGIPYSKDHFNEDEDLRIRYNWEMFALHNKIPAEEAPKAVQKNIRARHKDLFEHVDFTDLWHILCKGLPQRSAYQIQTRICRLYDPAILSGNDKLTYGTHSTDLSLSNEQLVKIDKMVSMGVSWSNIAKHFGRTVKRCLAQYRRWNFSSDHISRKLWFKLWKMVERVDSEDDDLVTLEESPLVKSIRRFCFSGSPNDKDKIIDSMDISTQADCLNKTEDAVRNTWNMMLTKLRKNVQLELKKLEPLADDLLFVRAINESFIYVLMVTFNQYMDFLRIMIEVTPDDTVVSSFMTRHYNVPDIECRMRRRGVTNFYCGNTTEFMYLFLTLRNVLYRCEKVVFSKLRRKYPIKERLVLVLQTFEYQWESLYKHQNSNYSGLLRMDIHADEKQIYKKEYLYINTRFFLDSLVTFTVKKQPEWIPPTKMLKYMIRPETKALFPETKDNSALVDPKEIYTLYGQ